MRRTFWKSKDGAVLPYVALMLTAMLAVVGLSFDLGRHYILATELQKAADAAAIAGAYQIQNGLPRATVETNITAAVQSAPFVVNKQKMGATAGNVSMLAPRFLNSIPADDDTPIGAGDIAASNEDIRYVEATTSATIGNNVFSRITGGPGTVTIQKSAVATKGASKCSITPLFMCKPPTSFAGGSSNPKDWVGHQMVVKYGPGVTSWGSGNYGLLDTPDGKQGASALADMIGGANGLNDCIKNEGLGQADVAPGVKNSLRNAFNVRFDMYEGNMNSNKNKVEFAPAENVTKGLISPCGNNPPDATPLTRLPRDSNIVGNPASATPEFGNGSWNCLDYWTIAHPGDANIPTGCTNGSPTITRYEVYLNEITTGRIPNLSASPGGENGNPQCFGKLGDIPPTPTTQELREFDRRIITVAIVDCAKHPVSGNTTVPVEFYLSMFMTEAVGPAAANADVYLEIVGSSLGGAAGGLVPVKTNEWVEVVR